MVDHAISCRETFMQLNDYVDRELSNQEQALVAEHLCECARCAAVFDFEETVLADLRAKLNRIRVPAALRDRVAEAIRRGSTD